MTQIPTQIPTAQIVPAALPEVQEFIAAVLERERLRLVDSVMQFLESSIRAQLRTGDAAGESLADLQTRVANAVGRSADYASERIARTETRRAVMVGRAEAWKQSGQVTRKRWVLSSNPCPVCVEVAQRFAETAIDRPFAEKGVRVQGRVLDFRDLEGGDAHPNCRCSIEPIFEEDLG